MSIKRIQKENVKKKNNNVYYTQYKLEKEGADASGQEGQW